MDRLVRCRRLRQRRGAAIRMTRCFPAALADHKDLLVAPVHIAAAQAEDLSGTGPVAHRQREERPVAVRSQRVKQRSPGVVVQRPRSSARHLRIIPDPAFGPEPLHRIVVSVRSALPTVVPRDWVHDRPQPLVAEELVEGRDHGAVVPDRSRGVVVIEVPLAGHLIHGPGGARRSSARRTAWLGVQLQPQRQVANLCRRGSIPLEANRVEPAPPSQQPVGVGADTARAVALRGEVTEELRNRADGIACVVVDQPRDPRPTGANRTTPVNTKRFKITSQGEVPPRDVDARRGLPARDRQ